MFAAKRFAAERFGTKNLSTMSSDDLKHFLGASRTTYTQSSMTTQEMYNTLKKIYGLSSTAQRADVWNAIRAHPNKLIMNMNDWYPTLSWYWADIISGIFNEGGVDAGAYFTSEVVENLLTDYEMDYVISTP